MFKACVTLTDIKLYHLTSSRVLGLFFWFVTVTYNKKKGGAHTVH